jgi:hypothetical protein
MKKLSKLEIRNKEIRKLRKANKKEWTLQKLGDKYDITNERVRQILGDQAYEYCKKHKRKFLKSCIFCESQKRFEEKLDQISTIDNNLLKEVYRLSKTNRQKEAVIQKILIVKRLRDQFGLSFPMIAIMLDKHHASIMNLYNKQI